METYAQSSGPFKSDRLEQIGPSRPPAGHILCVLLVHNEQHILPDFFRFYRALGKVHFIVVDDHSDDGTAEYLETQSDVSIFRPKNGSTYSEHKRLWRAELLDHFADDRWAIVPDADERLMWRDFATRSLDDLIADLEADGARGLYCVMVDFYKDGPLSEQIYSGADPLEVEFPHYDDPRKDPVAYRFLAAPGRFLKRWPTPRMIMYGGMRDRVFFGAQSRQRLWERIVFSALPTIRNVEPKGLVQILETFLRLVAKRRNKRLPTINLTKIPLVKWRKGFSFYGGAHAISASLPLSSETGVLLHFPITKGQSGVRYTVQHGQHSHGGAYYKMLLDLPDSQEQTFRYHGSSVFSESADLHVFMRGGDLTKSG